MKNKLWLRATALCLTMALLVGAVFAAGYTLDLSGDGKVNVWDLQLAAKDGKEAAHKEAILDQIVGGGDELRPNSEGEYEIWTVLGLNNMAKHAGEGATFTLMADIDLKGANWAPVAGFMGIFEGNGHTISNGVITGYVTAGDGNSVGFFGDTKNANNTTDRSRIADLNLVDMDIIITNEDVRYVGGIVGTNRCDLENCTFAGSITDTRTTLKAKNFVGAQVGRNANVTIDEVTKSNGVITGSNTLDALEYYDYEPLEGTSTTTQYQAPAKVNCRLAMFFAELEEGSSSRAIGIAGYSMSGGVPTDLVWQDTTNSSKYDSQVLRDRRATVTAAMYEMSTVEWTPAENLTSYTNGVKDSSRSRTGGNVYRGLPYNHGCSSIYRFLNYMEKNSAGRYQTTDELPNVGYYYTDSAVIAEINAAYAAGQTTTASGYAVPEDLTMNVAHAHQAGFPRYIGADCSSQTLMAWRTVNAVSGTGKITPTHTTTMYMCQEHITTYGLVPVNGFVLELPTTDLDGDGIIKSSGDLSIVVRDFTRANTDYYMQTLACTKKGDLLMDYTNEGGHTLMAMSDAVVIRTYNGTMDLDASYIVTAEQGGSGGTRKGTTADGNTWTSTCCVDEVNSFNVLYGTDSKDPNYPGCFFPITCAALRQEDTPAAQPTISIKNGVVSSNFQIISSTVNGETVYAQIQQSGHRSAYSSLTVNSVHPQVAAGDTVEILLANGQVKTLTYQ